jgi:hypothetical protein
LARVLAHDRSLRRRRGDHLDLVDYGRVEGEEILGGNPIFRVLLPARLLDLVAVPGAAFQSRGIFLA